MPAKLRLVWDVARHLTEAVLIPIGLFYGIVVGFGLTAALIAALAWAWCAVGARVVRRTRPPVLLLAATGLSTLQVFITYLADSATAFFLQPTAATFAFAAALLLSLRLKRPLIQRLAHDFCPLPDDVVGSAPLRRFFHRLSLLWAAVLLVQAGMTLAMLLTIPTTISVPASTAASVPVFLVGLTLSYVWFRASLRRGGFVLSWG